MEAFRQRLQQEASSRLEPYSREVFLSVGIKDSNKLLVRPLHFSLIDSYPVMSAKKCALQAADGSWINLFKSKAVYAQRKPGDSEEPKPPTYVDILAKPDFCERARLLPFEASVFKKHMLQGKDIPAFYLEMFKKEEANGGPKLKDPITYVGLSGVLEIDELMFNRDAYHVTFGIDPLSFYIARPIETRLKMEAVFPAAPGLTTSDYNFEASCPPPFSQKYQSYLPAAKEGGSDDAVAYPVLIADDFFADLELHKYHPSNEEFRESSGYRREFDWSKNPDYNRNLKQYMLTKASEKLQKPNASIKSIPGHEARAKAPEKTTPIHANRQPKSNLLAKLRSSSETFRAHDTVAAAAPPIDTDEVNRDFSDSLSDFEGNGAAFFAPLPDDLPPPDMGEIEKRSVMGLSDLKREGRSFSSAARDMGVEKTPVAKPWAKDKKPLPVFSASLTKTTKQGASPAWATPKQTTNNSSAVANSESQKRTPDQTPTGVTAETQVTKKPSLLGLLQGSKEVAQPTPTSSISM